MSACVVDVENQAFLKLDSQYISILPVLKCNTSNLIFFQFLGLYTDCVEVVEILKHPSCPLLPSNYILPSCTVFITFQTNVLYNKKCHSWRSVPTD